ncbi:Thyrostimulin beta-5 subunit [Eumeta japonica]|uniref:Thyrostimulin beta-5 subunit n=1 Tax=Eumeta variegata TaxID=151549 RepID=A0A4C1YLH4_EUMVA|nr:Thyrostimulin beta-5 subunit [Eumeta japonica]
MLRSQLTRGMGAAVLALVALPSAFHFTPTPQSAVADWEFPYKISRHPVCVHSARRPISLRLRHCDPNVERGTELYHYIAAEDCHCQKCSSESTSCEWLPPNSTLLGLDADALDDDLYRVNALV